MILHENRAKYTFHKGKSRFSFLPSGDISEFSQEGVMINGFQGSPKEGSENNIWLRIYGKDGIQFFPLLGIRSKSSLSRGENSLSYTGKIREVSYRVTFLAAAEGLWFWKVDLTGKDVPVDIVYGQDIGVALKENVLTNELYTAQYLGHRVFESANGFCVCSRQNQPQAGRFPYLQQGMALGKAAGYSTDGTQFFGLSYKLTNTPEILKGSLPCQNYQFEFSYTGLQSERIRLNGQRTMVFYGLFLPSHPLSITKPVSVTEILKRYRSLDFSSEKPAACPSVRIRPIFGTPYASPEWEEKDIQAYFPKRKLVESEKGKTLSFFTEDHTHVALQAKELIVERPHGNIIEGMPDMEKSGAPLLASTNYMYGIFNSQTVFGNSSFHRFLSVPRGLINVLKNSGQRIYLELGGKYRMLTLPAAYQMGINFSRWFYALPEDTLIITVFSVYERSDLVLEVRSVSGKYYRFLLANQLVLGENEFSSSVEMQTLGPEKRILRFLPPEERRSRSPYPFLHYDMQFPNRSYSLTDDRIFFEDGKPRDGTLICVKLGPFRSFRCVITGNFKQECPEEPPDYSFEQEYLNFRNGYRGLIRGFHLEKKGVRDPDLEALNETAWWFCHNAMIHYASPHGLEQTGGAAWGTRDVCQGPMEFFLALGHFPIARSTLLRVFSHQSATTHEWPQWFMFDRYPLDAGECHGDIVFWPLKAAADYLDETGDFSILKESIPYSGRSGTEPMLNHIERAVKTLQSRFLPGTFLISYAGGDWDDTLQPADDSLKTNLVSSWTQALAFQVLRKLSKVLQSAAPRFSADVLTAAKKMAGDFHKYLIRDGTIAGFVCRQPDGNFLPMLHPRDRITGIHYRLLPMTRSIIAELADPQQAQRNISQIDRHLRFPDGVRIMDRPAPYHGGVSRLFKRAEQAANVGREISLQYTHAHIRYIEAMAEAGEAERAWEGLLTVNPIAVRRHVPNALPRQSNLYFSSSDGMFPDRYRYALDFDKLRDGTVGVKGGWRLYSSGPGIYLHQLISNVLGIRYEKDGLTIDPVLPEKMDGLQFSFSCYGKYVTFTYHIARKQKGFIRILIGGKEIPGVRVQNPYRSGGIKIGRETLKGLDGGDISVELS